MTFKQPPPSYTHTHTHTHTRTHTRAHTHTYTHTHAHTHPPSLFIFFLQALYKYPNSEYPYADLVAENGRRGREDPEYEIEDTGCMDGDNYTDVTAEYCKAAPNDIFIRLPAPSA